MRGRTGGTRQAPTLPVPWSLRAADQKVQTYPTLRAPAPSTCCDVPSLFLFKNVGSARFVVIPSSVMGEFEELRL